MAEYFCQVRVHRHCEERMRRSNPVLRGSSLLRGARHRARVRATRWLAMTYVGRKLPIPRHARACRGHDDEYFFSYFTTAAVWPNNSLRSSSVRIAGWP